jgi:hypothetical protein
MLSGSGRALFTMVMWIILIVAMIPLTAITVSTLNELVIAIPGILAAAGVLVTGFIWQWGQMPDTASHESTEYLKRNRLTMALRDLSDDELKRLRQRLSNGDIDDDQLARLLDESEASKAKRY